MANVDIGFGIFLGHSEGRCVYIHVIISLTTVLLLDLVAGAEDIEPMYSRVLLIKRLDDESDIPLYARVGEKTDFNQLQVSS